VQLIGITSGKADLLFKALAHEAVSTNELAPQKTYTVPVEKQTIAWLPICVGAGVPLFVSICIIAVWRVRRRGEAY